jgi:hypothetical protein
MVFYSIVVYVTILYYTTLYATILRCILLYYSILCHTILHCTICVLEMEWPPPAHVSPICKVEGVASPIHFSFLRGDVHLLHLSHISKYRECISPYTSLLNGWLPRPLTVLHCIMLYSIVYYCTDR